MAAPFDSGTGPRFSPWSALTSDHSYSVAALRAAVISLVLLVALAVLVLF